MAEAGPTVSERLSELGLRRLGHEIRVDRYLLTSRGFELAAVLIPDFLELSSGQVPAEPKALGLEGARLRQRILGEWAATLSTTGAQVVLADVDRRDVVDEDGNRGRATELRPTLSWSRERSRWLKVS